MVSARAFVAISILLVLLAYIVPYIILYNINNLGLYVFWLLLTTVEVILALAYLTKGGRGWR
ncbi:MAG: hypothetical protein DRO40_12005 [Thermoprotei archaeon]|nr:MAG: hypothetical protein DRO40_12005 [Thermoprotei archaeon]